jgi:hypothetical protein
MLLQAYMDAFLYAAANVHYALICTAHFILAVVQIHLTKAYSLHQMLSEDGAIVIIVLKRGLFCSVEFGLKIIGRREQNVTIKNCRLINYRLIDD